MIVPKGKIENLLFVDIESAAAVAEFEELEPRMQALWEHKSKSLKNEDHLSPVELYRNRAALYPEFGKIVCVSVGAIYFSPAFELPKVKVQALRPGDSEEGILTAFKELVEKYPPMKLALCAHNGKEFDFPYICRRMLINGIELPEALKLSGKKPWEILHQDTMDMWRFGDIKNYTSLDMLSAVFGIPSPKVNVKGGEVSKLYYEGRINEIVQYCMEDVRAMIQVWLAIGGYELIRNELITLV